MSLSRVEAFKAEADSVLAADPGADAATAAADLWFAGRTPLSAAGPRRTDADDALVASWEPVSAEATPMQEKTAAPTPNPTASPPTRPIYLDALIASPDPAWVTLAFAVSNLRIM
jgi:hypothetical protein